MFDGCLLIMIVTYHDILKNLEARGIMPDRPPDLGRMRIALKRLELDRFPASRVVVIAGTNGKGSVAATLEALLIDAKVSTGLYTSPHLVDYTERVRVDGRDISRETFSEAFLAVDAPTKDLNLSHFEMLTLIAMWIFASGKVGSCVDWIILEVGLGGVWDATNAVPHEYCVITSIGMDHENILGRTLVEIARNKFGIVGRGSKVVHSPFSEELTPLARETKIQTSSRWLEARACEFEVEVYNQEPRFFLKSPWGRARLSLAGERAVENTATALTAFESLGFHPASHLVALQRVRWPGRMQRIDLELNINSPCPVYLSGDHNPQGIESLLKLLEHYPRKKIHILLGVAKDKNLDAMMDALLTLPKRKFYITSIAHRSRQKEDHGLWLNHAEGFWSDPREALDLILKLATPDDMILVTGSLYLVGHIRSLFMR